MLKNALEASPDGAVVTVGVRQHGEAEIALSVHNQSFMDSTVRLQVFKRYFSTKAEGRGLGTWGMKLLAEEYLGGRVSFTTDVEAGTTFILALPLKPHDA
jgi:signal transduction histidine kinase